MIEIWKDISGYEGKYQVSNLGRVKSTNFHRENRECLRKPHPARGGYLKVNLCKESTVRNMLIHRLVAMAFLPNPDNLPCVDHINGIRDDNRVENLRWCTQEENMNYPLTKTNHTIANRKRCRPIVCVETGKVYVSATEASKELHLTRGLICDCLNGRQLQTGGYHWQYI